MLKRCNDSYTPQVVDYIGADRVQCFYLYMDLLECGTEKPGVGLWISQNETGGMDAVFYQYYDALHMYSRGLCPLDEALELVGQLSPKVITGAQKDIDRLREKLDSGRYTYELSHIITAEKLMDGKSDLAVVQAGLADVPEIAQLMMKEHIYNTVYTYESLCQQLERRIQEGFGRLFVMRNDAGRLVATNATSAETEDLAVINGLVTDPDMRGHGLGRAITASTWNLVYNEGKQGLAFLGAENENTLSLHRSMGYTFLGLQARLIRED
jgi:predicted GNAT family acetyltransferase